MDNSAPAVFISHGSPMVAIEHDGYTEALAGLGRAFPAARAVLVISAHWQTERPVRVTAWERAPLVYDFGGFPEELYRLTYPAVGDPALAADVAGMLGEAGVAAVLEPRRGLDHGAWIPLRLAWPAAAIPVLEVTLPAPATPVELFGLGRALLPLRRRGIIVLGSGGIVHNLRRVRFHDRNAPVDAWAAEFDAWVAARLAAGDFDALLAYRQAGPHADLAVPSTEHFDPLFCVLGAAYEGEGTADIFAGFQYGNLSMRSFRFAAP